MKPGLTGRLMLAYAAVIAGVLFSAWWGQRTLAEAERSARQLSELSVESIRLTSNLQTIMQDKGRIADFLISGDPQLLSQTRPHRQEFQSWLEQMEAFVSTDPERSLLDRIRTNYAAYTVKADEVVRLHQLGRDDDAHRLFASIASDVDVLLGQGNDLFALVESDMRDRRLRADASLDEGERAVTWITGVGAILSLVLGFILSRYAARPIYQLALRLGSSGVVDKVEVAGNSIGVIEAQVGALIERVREQERALYRADKLKELGEIASEIAHETLNPLAGVKGMLQALRRTNLPREKLARELEDTERQLDRVEGIVRRLMDYARPLEPRVESTPVQRLLDDATRAASRTPAARDRKLRVVASATPTHWTMDPELIQQVLVNLLVNGCEASPPGSSVELRAGMEDGRLLLVVEDHGSGIPSSYRERLFRPFFTTKPKGNGLGLAVSRRIVREHGGQIEALAGDGGGSVFRILLP